MKPEKEIKQIVLRLKKKKINVSYIERALRLSFGSIKKWEKRCPKDAYALMKIIDLYPFMLNVADHQFDKNYARGCQLVAAGELLMEQWERRND